MLSVGVTGNIGSGKSTVCSIFRGLGVPIYEADLAVKQLYQEHAGLRASLVALLGEGVYRASGEFDAGFVRTRVFGDDDLRGRLNAIVHPVVFEDFAQWKAARALEGHPYVVVGVVAPMEIRKQRVISRDGMSEEDFARRVAAQWPQERWMERCDFLVHNDGETSIIEQVLVIHRQLLG
jgi:dephospho-CoA kinase